ncbi:hypothetical protein [Pseudomonas fluorescens]|uniref:hypothetical protein n=1 Tax=Pseudomonas fluorescens TaxID=294 RepID=UPI0017824DBC|nr:hypothetical protein [Pseudomonas fluorescens]
MPEAMTEQHGYLVRLVYPGFTQLVFEAYNDFGYSQASSIKTYKQWFAGAAKAALQFRNMLGDFFTQPGGYFAGPSLRSALTELFGHG